jgi:signal transduction histidine kinase
MSTIAESSPTSRTAAPRGFGLSALRGERSIALIRVSVVVAVMAIYVSSLGIRRSLGPAAVVVLALSAVYGLACLLLLSGHRLPSYRDRVITLFVDLLLVTLWIQSTGGPRSEFWSLYLIVVVSAALRFRLLETAGIALGVTSLHVSVTLAEGGLDGSQLIYRTTLMLATGFAVGVLSYQRAEHRSEREALADLAETRGVELGRERAELDRLRRLDVRRSEYVAIAAHEFRSPLAAIVGVLSTLRTHGAAIDREVREELLEGAAAQAERLGRLVEDLLTVSRIDDGVLRLHLAPADASDLAFDAARASGTADRLRVDVGGVGLVVCDADAVVRVLTNLLDNANKYAPGDAPLALTVSEDDEVVRFEVRDGGTGIPQEEREAVFERFRRLRSSDKPGAGLGLYISRGLVEAHGGTIGVTDAPEGGAAFTFTLPRRPVTDPFGVTEVTAAARGAN